MVKAEVLVSRPRGNDTQNASPESPVLFYLAVLNSPELRVQMPILKWTQAQ